MSFARLLSVLILAAACQLSAQPFSPSTNAPVITVPADQEHPDVISDPFGNAIVVWQDWRNGNVDLFVQKLNLLGQPLWQQGGVPVCTEATHQGGKSGTDGRFLSAEGKVQIVSDGTGGAIMAWRDSRNGALNGDIYAQRVDAAGAIAWTVDGIPVCVAVGEQSIPRLISDGNGGALIVWEDFRVGNAADIYMQRVDPAGNFLWQADGIPVSAARSAQRAPMLVSDGAGGAIVTWADLRNGSLPQWDVYAQRIDANGNPLWTTNGVPISRASQDQSINFESTIVSDGAGGAVIGWHDRRNGGAGQEDIYVQRIAANGVAMWTRDGVPVCRAAGQQTNPVLAPDGSGGAVLAWYDLRNGFSDLDVFVQRIDGSGAARWATDGVAVVAGAGNETAPHIQPLSQGRVSVIWEDYRSGTGTMFGQCFDGDGTPLLQADGAPLSSASAGQSLAISARAGAGTVISAWTETRDANRGEDIYAQIFFHQPTSLLRVINASADPALSPIDAYALHGREQEQQILARAMVHSEGGSYSPLFADTSAVLAIAPGGSAGVSDAFQRFENLALTPNSLKFAAIVGVQNAAAFAPNPDGLPAGLQLLTLEHTPQRRIFKRSLADISVSYFFVHAATDVGEVEVAIRPFGGDAVSLGAFRFGELSAVLQADWSQSGGTNAPAATAVVITSAATGATLAETTVDWGGSDGDLVPIVLSGFADPASNQNGPGLLVTTLGVSSGVVTSIVNSDEQVPAQFAVLSNYPNPFNPETNILYRVGQNGADAARVRLRVVDVTGRQVEQLVDGFQPAGDYRIRFDARELPSGMYFVQMRQGSQVQSHKMLLLR